MLAGLLIEAGSPSITNCSFVLNQADGNGGAVFNDGGDPSFTNCRFESNAVRSNHDGGAMYNANTAATPQPQPLPLCHHTHTHAVLFRCHLVWVGR